MAAWLDICRYLPTAGGTTDWTFSAVVPGYQSPTAAGVANGRLYKYRAESSDLSQWELGEGAYNTSTGVLARTTVLFNSAGTTAKINFNVAPQVAIVALKEDMISVEEANAFTTTQQAQARSNIGAAGLAAMAAKNVAINATVDISQELAATGATLVNSTEKYTADQWAAFYTHAAATAVVISRQITMVALGVPLAGFQNGHMVQATTAITAPASGDCAIHRHHVEGNRIAHWGWGATGAASVSVAFQFYSSASGTAFVRLSNGATATRFYYHEITVTAGWNFYSFMVAGDTSGTWVADNTKAFTFEVFSSGKETTPQAALDSWGATGKVQTTNSTNLLGTNGNATLVTGLYVDANGGQLPLTADLPLLMRGFDQDLALCQRYYEKSYDYATAPGAATTTGLVMCGSGTVGNAGCGFRFVVPKCGTPVTSYWDGAGTANVVSTVTSGTFTHGRGTVTPLVNAMKSAIFNAGQGATNDNLFVHYAAVSRL